MAKVEMSLNELESANIIDIYITRLLSLLIRLKKISCLID